MDTINYNEYDDVFEIDYKSYSGKQEYIKIQFCTERILIKKNGSETNVNLAGITDTLYTANQSNPPRSPYSNLFIEWGEVYLKKQAQEDPIEVASFMAVESKDLLLRDTKAFKIAELLAIKLSNYYEINLKYQYEIETKKKARATYWGLFIMVLIWTFIILMAIFGSKK